MSRSSPEFTTGGLLAKYWRRVNERILLYKSGTMGFATADKEPNSEFHAAQIAEAMGLCAVSYGLSKWRGKLCSTCELFTDKQSSFVAVEQLVKESGVKAAMEYYKKLNPRYYNGLINTLVFDAVICNEDRHFGNFGLLVENKANRIIVTAPVSDNGLLLFYQAMDEGLRNLTKYASIRAPAAYTNFVGQRWPWGPGSARCCAG